MPRVLLSSVSASIFFFWRNSFFVLRSLKEDAEAYLKEEVTEAVISVPAYFDDKRRKATKRAGELAGLKVEAHLFSSSGETAFPVHP